MTRPPMTTHLFGSDLSRARPLGRTVDVRQSRREESVVPRSPCLSPSALGLSSRSPPAILDSEEPDRSQRDSVDVDDSVGDACVGPQARHPVEKRAAINLILGCEGCHSDSGSRQLLIDRVEIPVLDRPQRDVHRAILEQSNPVANQRANQRSRNVRAVGTVSALARPSVSEARQPQALTVGDHRGHFRGVVVLVFQLPGDEQRRHRER